jgi:hypothetical protein
VRASGYVVGVLAVALFPAGETHGGGPPLRVVCWWRSAWTLGVLSDPAHGCPKLVEAFDLSLGYLLGRDDLFHRDRSVHVVHGERSLEQATDPHDREPGRAGAS